LNLRGWKSLNGLARKDRSVFPAPLVQVLCQCIGVKLKTPLAESGRTLTDQEWDSLLQAMDAYMEMYVM
jgi:hypothetical protein